MHKIETLLERIAAQNQTIVEQNEKILMLLSLRYVERQVEPAHDKPKSN